MNVHGKRWSEEARLQALRNLAVLDSAADDRFDRVTRLACKIFAAPIAAVSLIDQHRQWFKSSVGLAVSETPREYAFCDHAISEDGTRPFVVENALLDERFSDNPLVTGDPTIRSYAGKTIHDPEGFPIGTLCVIDQVPRTFTDSELQILTDLTAIVEDEIQRSSMAGLLAQLQESERRKSLILETLSESLVLVDFDGTIVSWNAASTQLFGVDEKAIRGQQLTELWWSSVDSDGSTCDSADLPWNQAKESGFPRTGDVIGVDIPNRGRIWLRVNTTPVRAQSGELNGVLIAMNDITEERFAALLAYRANHDELTDLSNRRHLEATLHNALTRCHDEQRSVGVCFLDIDHFKQVNDTYGHAFGDELLVRISDCIRSAVRPTDTPSRLGGDEFVVLLDPISRPTDAVNVAHRIIEAIKKEAAKLDPSLEVGASIGVAISNVEDTPFELLRRADGALYRAKARRDWIVALAEPDEPAPVEFMGRRV